MSQKRVYKLFKSPIDDRDIAHVHAVVPDVLPAHIDLSEEMPPVLDQGQLGSCASQATSNTLRHMLKMEKVHEFQPSRLYLYWNTRVNIEHSPGDQDTGVCIRDVCKALSKYHACNETVWPYIISKFSVAPPLGTYQNASLHKQVKYGFVPQTLNDIKTCLVNHHPVLIGIQVYDSLETQAVMDSGVIPMPDTQVEQCQGGHALILVGADDATQRFTIMNSWGTSVGLPDKKGFFTIPYAYVLNPNLASDFWALSFFE